jgi:DsbC/DsbD-like thiol-disulfide interchange protein
MKKLILIACAAAVLSAAPPNPVAWKIQNPPAKPVKAGARFTISLEAKVEPGWHLYSTKPLAEGPIPTRIWVGEGQPFTLNGQLASPPPETVQDANFGMEVEFYQGEAVFTLPVRVAAGTQPGARKLEVSASYQACNDKLCLPPRTVKVEAPVEIGK